MSASSYDDIISKRREFSLPNYSTLADVGFDGPWVSPYQITSKSQDGPCLVAYHWLDVPSIHIHRAILAELGYLPGIKFNNVLDLALQLAGLQRNQIYVTQAFHLLPNTRSERIPSRCVDASFDAITKHELMGRKVVALGEAASGVCYHHGVKAVAACHPSARGRTNIDKAREIADALTS